MNDPIRHWSRERLEYQYLGLLSDRHNATRLERSRSTLAMIRALIREFQSEYRRRGITPPRQQRVRT